MSQEQIEERLVKLETQVQRWKLGFTAILLCAAMFSMAVGAYGVQVNRTNRLEADTIVARNLVLQDDKGKMRGFLDGGGGYTSPSLKFFDTEQNTSVSLEAGTDVGSLFLSAGGGDKGPTMNLRASRQTLLPSGISISDENRKGRVEIDVNNGKLDGLSRIALNDKSGKEVVYLSGDARGGGLELQSTEGSVELGAVSAGLERSEPHFSIWDRDRNERIKIGMKNGEPKLQILDREERIGWEAGIIPNK